MEKYYQRIIEKVDEMNKELDFGELCMEFCDTTSSVEGCISPSEGLRKKGFFTCIYGRAIPKICRRLSMSESEFWNLWDRPTDEFVEKLNDVLEGEDIAGEFVCEHVYDWAQEYCYENLMIPEEFIDQCIKEFFGDKIELPEYYDENGNLIRPHPLRS